LSPVGLVFLVLEATPGDIFFAKRDLPLQIQAGFLGRSKKRHEENP